MARIKQHTTSRLVFQRAIGTTARDKNGISVAKSASKVAYLTGAGAVVICTNNSQVQRFFCTSTKYNQHIYTDDSISNSLNLPQISLIGTFGSTGSPSSPMGYGLGLSTGGASPSAGLGSIAPSPGASGVGFNSSNSARDKLKPCSAIALSPDGTWLATGETGHQPRVFIYSTKETTCIPVAILSEHTFGLKSLAFSPCGKYLASLGTRNDGFMHIWSIPEFRLLASNKCTSLVNSLIWLSSNKIVTAGLRHLRLWTVRRSGNLHSLGARNVVLHDHIESTFFSLTRISDKLALVASDTGYLATLRCRDDSNTASFEIVHKFEKIKALEALQCADHAYVIADNALYHIELLSFAANLQESPMDAKALFALSENSLLALKDNQLVRLPDSGRLVRAPQKDNGGLGGMVQWSSGCAVWNPASNCARVWDSNFKEFEDYVISKGTVTALGFDERSNLLILGSSDGLVEIIQRGVRHRLATFQAHGSTVQNISVLNGMIVSCSRDKTVQIFRRDPQDSSWALCQTVMAHKGNILRVFISADGQRIVSCSTDRTVHIHKLIGTAFISERLISLRSNPSDMAMCPDTQSIIIAFTDKTFSQYSITTGELKSSFRDDIDLKCICTYYFNGTYYLAGAGSDKSIRLYNFQTGALLSLQWAHSDGITGMVWSPESQSLTTVGGEGCLFIWQMAVNVGETDLTRSPDSDGQSPKPPPTRKFLSRTEIARIKSESPPVSPRAPSSPSPPPSVPSTVPKTVASRQTLQRHRSLSASRSFPSLTRNSEPRRAQDLVRSLDEATTSLSALRLKYDPKLVAAHPEKVARFKAELHSALRMFDVAPSSSSPSSSEPSNLAKNARMEEMLQQFGDQLVSLVDTKLRL